jgi:YVTN family beta-propeller protein
MMTPPRSRPVLVALLCSLLVWAAAPALARTPAAPANATDDFANFESAHVHPIAVSADGRRVFAVNTPEARLAVFDVLPGGGLRLAGDVRVGLEPVSLAVRPGTEEVWVANHLSDTVSIVDTAAGRVRDTLAVGDEPTDVAFASGRAFVSLAGNADRVVVFDAETREHVATIDVPGDDPRALATDPRGDRVALVVLESGNATTTVHTVFITPERPAPPPHPARDVTFPPTVPWMPAPAEPLIVQRDAGTGRWLDEAGNDWSDVVFFGRDQTLADADLFWIDAGASPPAIDRLVSGVGTSLFDVAIHPTTGDAWVPNTDARNLVRFEPALRGHFVETRISIVDARADTAVAVDLNPHIDRSVTPGPASEIDQSLAMPVAGVFDRPGHRYFLAAFGSDKVAVLDGRSGDVIERIDVEGGPSGLAVHPTRPRLYVMQRFTNGIAVVDTRRGRVVSRIGVAGPRGFDPSPPAVRAGRRLLYDARHTSGHGDVSCASCHLFGHFDGLAWDLGDPGGEFLPFAAMPWLDGLVASPHRGFDPMKGPMVTQSLRGLPGTEPLHWRGDRADVQAFNPAFVSLLGRGAPLSPAEIDLFADFVATIRYAPNPNRLLDDDLPDSVPGFGDPREGETIFHSVPDAIGRRCVDCHSAPEGGAALITHAGGEQSFEVPQLRATYEKMALDTSVDVPGDAEALKGGFGLLHAGALSMQDFLGIARADLGPRIEDLIAFLVSFPTGTAPCVGHQRTVDADGIAAGLETLWLLVGQAGLGRCDVIAHGLRGGEPVGYAYVPETGLWRPDHTGAEAPFGAGLLTGLAGDDALTLTGVPVGSAARLGIDRDRDGCLDGDERTLGTDPASPGTPQPDSDGDGIPDTADRCPGWVQTDAGQRDADGDGVPDACQCGDVSDDGRVDWRDVVALWIHLVRPGRLDLSLEKCNVTGAAGSDPALCDGADLQALWARLWRPHRSAGVASDTCWPLDRAPLPDARVCVDPTGYPLGARRP